MKVEEGGDGGGGGGVTVVGVGTVISIRESMIEEYVLELQKRKGWQSEMTRQIMNFLVLQFLLKNIQPQDFTIVHGKIVNIALRPGDSTETSPAWNRYLDSPLSDMKKARPLPRKVKIPVIPMTKKDLIGLQYRSLPSGETPGNNITTISSYDLWSRYLELNRGFHGTS